MTSLFDQRKRSAGRHIPSLTSARDRELQSIHDKLYGNFSIKKSQASNFSYVSRPLMLLSSLTILQGKSIAQCLEVFNSVNNNRTVSALGVNIN